MSPRRGLSPVHRWGHEEGIGGDAMHTSYERERHTRRSEAAKASQVQGARLSSSPAKPALGCVDRPCACGYRGGVDESLACMWPRLLPCRLGALRGGGSTTDDVKQVKWVSILSLLFAPGEIPPPQGPGPRDEAAAARRPHKAQGGDQGERRVVSGFGLV